MHSDNLVFTTSSYRSPAGPSGPYDHSETKAYFDVSTTYLPAILPSSARYVSQRLYHPDYERKTYA